MKITALRLILCAVVATVLSLNLAAQTSAPNGPIKAGAIKAVGVTGEVSKKAKDGTVTPLKNNDPLTESDTVITTGKNSSVVLVFMNASTVKLGGDTALAIEEFKMDDLDKDLDMAAYKNRATDTEPSVSKTSLSLAYGEMVGDVKHLNRDKGSSYNIKTPVGAAGIRGTIYRIVYKPDSSGKAFFQVTTAEGLVVMQGLTTQEIPIAADKEITVTVDVPDPTSTTPPAPLATIEVKGATEENKSAINTATATITEAIQSTTFNTTPTPPTPTPTEEPKKEEPKKEETPTPPPAVVPPATTLTPGAGG